ncbi:hypothetical protein ACVWYH_001478 [Bradyrhizobium sp. GM24.11]
MSSLFALVRGHMFSRAQLQQLLNNLLELGPRRLMALGLIGFAVLVTVVGGAYYLSRPEFETLYTGLNREDVTRIGAALREQSITFDISAAGDAVSGCGRARPRRRGCCWLRKDCRPAQMPATSCSTRSDRSD